MVFIFFNTIKTIRDYLPYDLYRKGHRILRINFTEATLQNICLWHGSS